MHISPFEDVYRFRVVYSEPDTEMESREQNFKLSKIVSGYGELPTEPKTLSEVREELGERYNHIDRVEFVINPDPDGHDSLYIFASGKK